MISLQLLEACENCTRLAPKREYIGDIQHLGWCEPVMHITCENINTCRALLDYLKKEEKKNGRKEK